MIIITKKYDVLDNLKALLIFLVVLGHFIEPINQNGGWYEHVYTVIYSFHIPLFALISGFLLKHNDYVSNPLKLIFPAMIFQSVYSIVTYLVYGTIYPMWVLWYILALLVWNTVTEDIKRSKYTLLAIALAATFVMGGLTRIIFMYPFFLVGSKLDLEKIRTPRYKKRLIGASVVSSIILMMGIVEFYDFYYTFSFDASVIEYLQLGLAYFISFSFVLSLVAMIPNRKFKYLNYIGQYSLVVYMFHPFINIALLQWFPNIIISNPTGYFLIAIISALIVTFVPVLQKVREEFTHVMEYADITLEDKRVYIKHVKNVVVIISLLLIIYPILTNNVVMSTRLQDLQGYQLNPNTHFKNDHNLNKDLERYNEQQKELEQQKSNTKEDKNVVKTEEPFNNLKKKDFKKTAYSDESIHAGEVFSIYNQYGRLSYNDHEIFLSDQHNHHFNLIETADESVIIRTIEGQFIKGKKFTESSDQATRFINLNDGERKTLYNQTLGFLAIIDGAIGYDDMPAYWHIDEQVKETKVIPYYTQLDPSWREDHFSYRDVGSTACGPTALTMIIDYLKSDEILPTELFDLSREYDLDIANPPRIDMEGLLAKSSEKYNFNYREIKQDEVIRELKNGNKILLHTYRNEQLGYTFQGHYLVLDQVTGEGLVSYLDPYPGDISAIPSDERLPYHGEKFNYKTVYGQRSETFTGYATIEDYFAKSKHAFVIWD